MLSQWQHGLERLVCVQLVLSAPPQKPHFYTLVGWTGSNAHLKAYLKAAPLLDIQLGLVNETWSRKTSLCATSSVSPAPKAPLLHTCGLDRFKCTSRGLPESSPTSGNTIGAGQGNMV
ncbi:hypothetical protein ABBQ38_006593 [Trebouxia sp. C0009 RCD-2024]